MRALFKKGDIIGQKYEVFDVLGEGGFGIVLHYQASIPKLDSPLFPLINRCLAKDPRKRYQAFRKLRADLALILNLQTGEIVALPGEEELETWSGTIRAQVSTILML